MWEPLFFTLPGSTSKHSLSFTNHFNSSETILIKCTDLVSYILASIRLVHFGSPYRTASFADPLVSLCAFFDFNSCFLTHGGMPLITFLVTPWIINFSCDFTLPWKGGLVVYIIYCTLIMFSLHSIKKGHHSIMKWQYTFSQICFGEGSLHINIVYVYPSWKISNIICL